MLLLLCVVVVDVVVVVVVVIVVVVVVVAAVVVVAVVAAGLSAVLWGTVWVGSVLLDIRRAKAQNRTSPCRKFLSIWSHVCLRCLCEKRGVASVRRSGDSKETSTFTPDLFVRDGRSKDPSLSEITELLLQGDPPLLHPGPS